MIYFQGINLKSTNLGPGPELEYKRGRDSRPHRGSREGWRVVVLGGGTDTIGGETAGSGGDKGGSSIGIGGRELLIALPVQEKRCFKLTFRINMVSIDLK